MPSDSVITNVVNIVIEISYIVVVGLFYGYNKLTDKTVEAQMGFSISLIVIKGLVIAMIIIWIIYRGILVIRET